MNNIELRPYQQECIESVISYYKKGVTRQLISLPTGSGKTIIFSSIISKFKLKTLVFVPTIELLNQTLNKIFMINPDIKAGFIDSYPKELNNDVVISTVQAAMHEKNLNRLIDQNFNLLIWDECHHAATSRAREIIDKLGFSKNSKKLLIGMTATAYRHDKKGLAEVFDEVVYQLDTKQMIDLGYLCPPVGFKIINDLDLSSAMNSGDKDFSTLPLAKIMNTPEINKKIVEFFIEKDPTRKTIVFTVDIDHAKKMAEMFKSFNFNAQYIYGEIDGRAQIIEDFIDGKIQILCNCQVLTEGFDVAQTDCIIVARPTKSRSLYTQMVGRGLRIFPNKRDCFVFDFGEINHNICDVAILYKDAFIESKKYIDRAEIEKELGIPFNLNRKLKFVLFNIDLLKKNFLWKKDGDKYFMKGRDRVLLEIYPIGNKKYSVRYNKNDTWYQIATKLSFDYAFAKGEEFAKKHRDLFIFTDVDAKWRNDPITDRQVKLFKSFGYKTGICDLSKGQASQLIDYIFDTKL